MSCLKWIARNKTGTNKKGRITLLIVDELMTRELYTLSASDSVHRAHQVMKEKKIHHIPIVDDNDSFVGLVTERDVMAAAVSSFAEISPAEREEIEQAIPLAEVMTTEIVVIESGADLRQVAKHFLQTKHGCLPVVSNGSVEGIITEEDFVKLALALMDKLAEYEAMKH
jgi:CBS domain-containing membrane protein